MYRKFLMAALCLATAASVGLAKKERARGGAWGSFGPYVGMFKFDELNKQLTADTYNFTEEYKSTHFMLGGGGLVVRNKVTIGGYGFGGEQRVGSDKHNLDLVADYGGGMFEFGFAPITNYHFMLGVGLGVGGSGFVLRATSVRGWEPSFDDMLVNGVRGWEITNSNFALAPAVNIVIPISWAGIHIKGGYLLTLFDKNWKYGTMEVVNPPNLSASGPFLSLQVAFGGSSHPGKVKPRPKSEPEWEPEPEKQKTEEPEEPEEPEDQ